MTIYVDNEQVPWRGKLWCHLVADSLEELHQFAFQLGLRKTWFQSKSAFPHYDVTLAVRERALKLGAQLGSRATVFGCAKVLRSEMRSQLQDVAQSA
jgi:Protein of unknown function (DUF4031)